MDNKTYLQSIATRPDSPTKKPFTFKNIKLLKFLILGAFLLITLLIFQNALATLKAKPKNALHKLHLHSQNLSSLLDTYTPQIKSPGLRKINSSLKISLSELQNTTTTYLSSLPKASQKPPASIQKDFTQKHHSLSQALEDARINDQLDRQFLENIIYQTSFLSSLLSEANSYANSLPKNTTSSLKSLDQNLSAIRSDFVEFKDPLL